MLTLWSQGISVIQEGRLLDRCHPFFPDIYCLMTTLAATEVQLAREIFFPSGNSVHAVHLASNIDANLLTKVGLRCKLSLVQNFSVFLDSTCSEIEYYGLGASFALSNSLGKLNLSQSSQICLFKGCKIPHVYVRSLSTLILQVAKEMCEDVATSFITQYLPGYVEKL